MTAATATPTHRRNDTVAAPISAAVTRVARLVSEGYTWASSGATSEALTLYLPDGDYPGHRTSRSVLRRAIAAGLVISDYPIDPPSSIRCMFADNWELAPASKATP